MRVLSFDIEEWYIEKHFKGGRKENIISMISCLIGF